MILSKDAPAVFLEWDTAFFGKRIGRVLTHNMSEKDAAEVDMWVVANRIDCVYYLAEGINSESSIAAENHHYHQVDLRVTYGIDLSRFVTDEVKNNHIRPATADDIPSLRAMTRHNHEISRFFADARFDREKSMQLYEMWIERDFTTKDHLIWVWDEGGQPVAYTSVYVKKADDTAEIGLIGVHPDFRGRGMGYELQIRILVYLKKLGLDSVEVATQGRNIYAQNLYQKSGYKLKSINLWYHKWYTNP